MKELVVYSSQSGNTEMLAKTVYKELGPSREIHAVENAPDPADYDYIAVGFWLQGGRPDHKAADYLKKLNEKQLIFYELLKKKKYLQEKIPWD